MPTHRNNQSVRQQPEPIWRRSGLGRRDGGTRPCRGLCGINTPTSVLVGRSSELKTRGLRKRTLSWPITIANLDQYYITEFEDSQTYHVLTQEVGHKSSSVFNTIKPYTGDPFQVGVQGLCGCTTLIVISPRAIYMAHFL
jgi:hypothetical protein